MLIVCNCLFILDLQQQFAITVLNGHGSKADSFQDIGQLELANAVYFRSGRKRSVGRVGGESTVPQGVRQAVRGRRT